MTFEEYEKQYLQDLTDTARHLVRMGWNARGEFGADHIPDAAKMVRGDVALAGDIKDEDGTTFHRALVVQFSTKDDFRSAIQTGQCRFTVFGGEV